ncbi:MAG: hypothetical protein WDM76_15140 [Limisphaerales bacterium]
MTNVAPKPKRAITHDEHNQILLSDQCRERKLFYEMLWETGASQTDASRFSSENADWTNKTFVYCRAKTGTQATITIGGRQRIYQPIGNNQEQSIGKIYLVFMGSKT